MSSPIKISNEFKKKYGHEVVKYKTDHLHQLDKDLAAIASCLPIELMPGEEDLSTIALPQKPIPKALFPALASQGTITLTTNPSLFDIETIR